MVLYHTWNVLFPSRVKLGPVFRCVIFHNNFRIQDTSRIHDEIAIYSASPLDDEIIVCFLLFRKSGDPFKSIKNPFVAFLVSWSPP